jgi:hypothetical protein
LILGILTLQLAASSNVGAWDGKELKAIEISPRESTKDVSNKLRIDNHVTTSNITGNIHGWGNRQTKF